MARPKLSSADQPWAVRVPLQIYEALASLKLAVLLIATTALVLGCATGVESVYGTAAVHFGIYGTWWFAAMTALLGTNVFCAAMIRFPWKRYQTGFVITHAGIIVLLIGTLISRLGGIDAQLPVFEGQSEHLAFEDTQHFELSIFGNAGAGKTTAPSETRVDATNSPEGIRPDQVVKIPFVAGPFNWRDYARLSPFPWRFSHRDQGVLYDQDGIRLEVLDYLSNSRYAEPQPLKLTARSKPTADAGAPAGQSTVATELELGVRRVGDPHSPHNRMPLGSRDKLPGGERVVFWVADSHAATEAFRQSKPELPPGDKGLVVLYASGQKYQFPVDKLLAQKKMPIGDTGLELEAVSLEEQFLGLRLLVHAPEEPDQEMLLFGDVPEFNRQDREHGIYGTYWVDSEKLPKPKSDAEEGKSMREAAKKPRIDILEGSDQKLYYRAWTGSQFDTCGELPTTGSIVTLRSTSDPVTLAVDQFVPSDKPGKQVLPGPLMTKGDRNQVRQALVRLTVDGQSEQFWLEGLPQDPRQEIQSDQRKVVVGSRRRVALVLPRDRLDVGFRLYLHKFERKLDPGTSQASWYASLVDMLDRDQPRKKLEEKVLITLNEPVNFTDPATGRSYRVYQESFAGPFKPGEPIFDSVAGGEPGRGELFLSWLTFNYDPGRGLKYFGSLLIVAGIGTMFYMRAYFFRRRADAAGEPA